MAFRNRAASTTSINQENTKSLKSMDGLLVPTRRAALGEIGNKVNSTRGTDLGRKQTAPAKGHKKPVAIAPAKKIIAEKAIEKPPVQIVKPVAKKETSVKVKADPVEIVQKEPEPHVEAFSSDLLGIDDIDEIDKRNPNLVSIYSNDIYDYLEALEKRTPILEGFLSGQAVSPKMRSILIDWLVEVHQQFHLLQETLYLTVAIIDRFLASFTTITRKQLQLVGVTAMFLASKYEEMYAPDISDFVYIADNAYSKKEILKMELLIFKTLDFSLGRPLPIHFLRRYSKAGQATPVQHTMAKYFLEQSLVHYEMCHYRPSLLAAAALYLSIFLIGEDNEVEGQKIWNNTLIHYSKYKDVDLMPVVRAIAEIIINSENSKYKAVKEKFKHNKHMKISLRPELKSPSISSLANKTNE